jgi:diacylglycerol kinase (ATP)
MPARCALLLNLHSRRVRRDPSLLPSLGGTFGDRGPFLALRDPSELQPALEEILRFRPDLLFVCGGDGTLRQTLSGLIRAYGDTPLPKVAILKTGTMNTVAGGLGIRRSAIPQLTSLLARPDGPFPSVKLHPLSIDGTHGFIFAVGGFSDFITRYAAVPDPSPLRAVRMLARTTISSLLGTSYARSIFPPFRARIRTDGKPFPGPLDVTTISASAVRHIGFGFRPFAQAEGPTGEFAALILRSSPTSLLRHFLAIRRGRPIRSRTIEQFAASELAIELESERTPMVDGDLLPPRKEFALRRGPAVDFVTG